MQATTHEDFIPCKRKELDMDSMPVRSMLQSSADLRTGRDGQCQAYESTWLTDVGVTSN